jgi:UrcA family protein
MNLCRIAITGAALFAACAPSLASAEEEAVIVKVSFAGLDLAKPRDMAIANRRLASAIDEVCGASAIKVKFQREPANVVRCREVAQASVKAQLAARNGGKILAAN